MKDSLNNPFNVMRHKSWDNAPRLEAVATYLISVGVPTAIAYVGAYVGITMVTSWAINALSPKPDFGAAGQRGLLTNVREANAPQEIVYGEVRKGGVITYMEATGTDNEYLHLIISMAGHEINSFENFYINDQEVTLDANGFVTESEWIANSDKKVLIKPFTGSPTQNIYTTLSALTDGPTWANKETGDDTNFRGQGIACLYVRLRYDQNVFAQGIPLITAKIKGKKVEDPRTSTTAYSANAALCIRDYLISKYGMNATGEIDDTSFNAAANVCDESVSLSGGGTENRYEMHGAISLARTPSDILSSMMTTCNGNLFWGQGKWILKAGDYSASVETFTLDDLRGPITVDTKVSRRDNFNVVRGLFVSAADDYVKTDYPQIRSQTFIDDDGGIENALDLELPLTTSSTMAQRLAKMTLFRAREQMVVQADFSLKAFDVQVGDVVSLTISRYGWNAKQFEVVGWSFQNDPDSGGQTVSLTLRETSSAAYDWNAEEEDLKVNDSNLPSFVASSTSGASIVAVYASDASGTGKSYTPSASLTYVLYYQYTGTSLPNISTITGTWVKFVGDDGQDGQDGQDGANGINGTNGTNGSNGSRHAVRRYYKEASSTPSVSGLASNVSYNWSTGVATSSYNGWSTASPTVDAAGSNSYYYSDVIFIDATGSAASSSGSNASSAVKLFNFNGLVTFTNASGTTSLNTALADSSTQIDGGRITTGTVEADRIKIDNVTLDTNASSQLIIKDGGVGTDKIAANAISAIGYQNFTNSNYTVFNAQTLNTRVVEFTFATVAGVAVEFEYNLVFEPYAHSVSQNRLSSTTGNGWELRARAAIAYNASNSTFYFFGPEQRYFAEKHNISFAPLITATGTVILPSGNAQNHSSAKFAVYIAQSIRDTSANLDTYWDEGRVSGTLKARYIKK